MPLTGLNWQAVDDGASLAWDGGRYIYATHGSDCSDNQTSDFARFDLEGTPPPWQMVAPIPGQMNDGGSLAWDGDNRLFALIGGKQADAYFFDLTNQSWTTVSSLPCPAGAHVGSLLAWIGTSLYAWQGSTSSAACGGNAIMSLTP